MCVFGSAFGLVNPPAVSVTYLQLQCPSGGPCLLYTSSARPGSGYTVNSIYGIIPSTDFGPAKNFPAPSGAGEQADERAFIQLGERAEDGQASYELRNHAEGEEVFRHRLGQDFLFRVFLCLLYTSWPRPGCPVVENRSMIEVESQ